MAKLQDQNDALARLQKLLKQKEAQENVVDTNQEKVKDAPIAQDAVKPENLEQTGSEQKTTPDAEKAASALDTLADEILAEVKQAEDVVDTNQEKVKDAPIAQDAVKPENLEQTGSEQKTTPDAEKAAELTIEQMREKVAAYDLGARLADAVHQILSGKPVTKQAEAQPEVSESDKLKIAGANDFVEYLNYVNSLEAANKPQVKQAEDQTPAIDVPALYKFAEEADQKIAELSEQLGALTHDNLHKQATIDKLIAEKAELSKKAEAYDALHAEVAEQQKTAALVSTIRDMFKNEFAAASTKSAIVE